MGLRIGDYKARSPTPHPLMPVCRGADVCTAHCALRTAHCALRTALCAMRYALCAMRYALCAMRHSQSALYFVCTCIFYTICAAVCAASVASAVDQQTQTPGGWGLKPHKQKTDSAFPFRSGGPEPPARPS
jgi:hypothetical protein